MYRYQLSPSLIVRPLDEEVALFSKVTDNIHLLPRQAYQAFLQLAEGEWAERASLALALQSRAFFSQYSLKEIDRWLMELEVLKILEKRVC